MDQRVFALVRTLEWLEVDRVVVTGDVTEMGRHEQIEQFFSTFGRLIDAGKIVVVPGNHDCLGDDVSDTLMSGARVQVEESPGLFLVRVNSTGPHNRSLLTSHGHLTEDDLHAVDDALEQAPRGSLRVVALHHHPLPLPTENLHEAVSTWLGWPHAAEIPTGSRLLARIAGRSDLVLHGHRHVERESRFAPDPNLRIFNAGCTPGLGRFRVFPHRDGRLLDEPRWHEVMSAVGRQPPRSMAVASAWVRGLKTTVAAAVAWARGSAGSAPMGEASG